MGGKFFEGGVQQKHRFYPHRYNNRFSNFAGEVPEPVILPSVRMYFESLIKHGRGVSLDHWVKPYQGDRERPHITWIGHSTFLILFKGLTIITDPIFDNLSFVFKRITPPGISLEQLPPIDVVLISHNHRDHMDRKSLVAIAQKNPHVTILVPWGDKAWFDRRGFNNVHECMWWEQHTLINTQEIISPVIPRFTFLPAYHWSQRGLFDRNKSLWGSWMIEADQTIYFAGDTGYGHHFSAIAKEFKTIDISLMPVGPCDPHHLMQFSHVNAEEAGQSFLDLNAHHFMPMHWGTYWFGTDHPILPIERLTTWWQQQNLSQEQLHILKFGEHRNFDDLKPISTPAKPIQPIITNQQELL